MHWSNARFDHAVHSYASNLTGLATLPLPNLCSDVRAWKAGNFTTVPKDVLEIDEQAEPLNLPFIPWNLVAPYVHGHDASLVKYIEGAELKTEEAEFMLGQKDWYQVIETVGLAPSRRPLHCPPAPTRGARGVPSESSIVVPAAGSANTSSIRSGSALRIRARSSAGVTALTIAASGEPSRSYWTV